MIRTGVFTAVERSRAGPALGCVMLLILLMGSGVSAGVLPNPSFEVRYSAPPYERPQSWLREGDSCFSWRSYSNLNGSGWSTDGTWSVAQFNLATTRVTGGQYQSLFQDMGVDLTGIGTIKFDAQLAVFPIGSPAPFAHFEASFLVDGVPLWRQTAGGEYLDQEVNVAGLRPRRAPDGHTLSGHRIEVRITALDTGTFGPNYYTLWDNVRLIEGLPTIDAVVALDPGTLNLASNGNWITCYIELPKDGSGMTYDVSTIDGASVTLSYSNTEIHACTTGDQGWATTTANADNVADFDGDGVLERMVKFDRAAVQRLVQPLEATVTIQGDLAGGTILFKGEAVIRVIDNKAQKQ